MLRQMLPMITSGIRGLAERVAYRYAAIERGIVFIFCLIHCAVAWQASRTKWFWWMARD
jgi:hypothetical protein